MRVLHMLFSPCLHTTHGGAPCSHCTLGVSLGQAFLKGTRRCGENASRQRTMFAPHPFSSFAQAFLKACGFQRRSLGRASQRAKFSLRRFFLIVFSLRLLLAKKKRLRRLKGKTATEIPAEKLHYLSRRGVL